MSTVLANGLSVHVERLAPPEPASGAPSTAPTAVLIHGLALDTLASWYLTLAQPLAAAGLDVVMYDLRGHGHTERPAEGYALDDFVDDLAALLAALDITGPVVLLGNSFGGTIAFAYAARHPERVAAIVAVEAVPPIAVWRERMPRWLSNAVAYLPDDTLAGIDGRGGLGRRARSIREVITGTSLMRDVPASRISPDEHIAAIGCPVLCVYGGAATVGDLAPDVRRLLPQARIVIVPGQRHTVLVDEPDSVRDIVLPWLLQSGGLHRGHHQLACIDQ
ncbi:alpha/beta fold hydrolase [Dactylosporangium sp. NPDC000244]|uniref:alpha/beta fold hydrolase n=1 Tax=Dactylosporangium sp. NPDC000244 TaxID=3154365 RepID=UPI00331B63B1